MFDAAVAPGRPALTTPGRLVRWLAAIVVLAGLVAAASLWTAARIADAAQTVGRDAEPSVALALRMAATLGDMDAAALADSLTDNGAATGTSWPFRAGTDQLAADIVAASRNITYGEAEAAPLRELQRMLALYQQAVVEARYIGDGNAWITSRRVQWASRVNRDFAVPQAEALAQVNADELEQHYAAYLATSLLFGAADLAAFALLVAVLAGAQVWLARRTRRVINPLLAAATVAAVASGLWFGGAVLNERADLRAAKADAYDSLRVLFQAKSAASQLRADMSLWLLDPSARAEANAGIDEAAHALTGINLSQSGPAQQVQAALAHALAEERGGNAAQARSDTPHVGGFLGAELDNITFGVPERTAATDCIARLTDAEGVMRAVLAEEQGQRRAHVFAVTQWLEQDPGGGGAAFKAVEEALDRTIAINQAEFDRRVTSALRTATQMPFITCGALVLVALLSAGGVWLRLREYR